MLIRSRLTGGAFYIAGCVLAALIVESRTAVSALRGHGLWLFVAGMVIVTPCVILAHSRRMPHNIPRQAAGVGLALILMATQYNAPFGFQGDIPYVLRVAFAAAILMLGMGLGRWSFAVWAPETDAERAQP